MSWSCALPGGSALPVEESSRFSAPTAFGMYRVLHQTGSGVLGPVFRAFDLRHDSVVAVKAFPTALGPEHVARLADGLRRLAATPPPVSSVVLPIDAGIETTTPFIVMPALAGETLDTIIRRDAPVPPEYALPLLRAIAAAIDVAAANGLDHGALHPRDVFVAPDGAVSVTGYGIRRALESVGVAAPRRPYSAPEVWQSAWDRAADLYSFGAIAHELLTRRPPVRAGEQDGEFTADLAAERRVQLRQALAAAIAERPADRYANAASCVEAIAAAGIGLGGVSVDPAQPPDRGLDSNGLQTDPSALQPADDREAWTVGTQPGNVPLQPSRRGTADLRGLEFAPSRPRRAAALAGLVAVGALGALAGHLAVRVLRQTSGATAVPTDVSGAVEQTEVVIGQPGAPQRLDTPRRHTDASETPANASVAAGLGRLWIHSEPAGALVSVDGKRFGQTPAELADMPFGAHEVQVARAGYVPHVARVTLGANVPEQRLSFVLRPGLRAEQAIGGALEIVSRPRGARVVVDGRFVGHAPLRVPKLKPGTYTVTLELAGYQPYTGRVGVTAGRLSTVKPTLHFNR